MSRTPSGTTTTELAKARSAMPIGTASVFVTSDLTSDAQYDADPATTFDGTTTHVVWRKQISAPPSEQWAIYHASRTTGGSWAKFESIAVLNGNPGFSPSVGSDTAGDRAMLPTQSYRPAMSAMSIFIPAWQARAGKARST